MSARKAISSVPVGGPRVKVRTRETDAFPGGGNRSRADRIDGDAGASVRARAAPIARTASSAAPTSNDAGTPRATKPRPSHAAATHRRFTLGTLDTTDDWRWRSTRGARASPSSILDRPPVD